MNSLSNVARIILCIIIALVGFIVIPIAWVAWQNSLGFKTPGIVFLLIIFGVTAVVLKAIWNYKPINSQSKDIDLYDDKHKLDKN